MKLQRAMAMRTSTARTLGDRLGDDFVWRTSNHSHTPKTITAKTRVAVSQGPEIISNLYRLAGGEARSAGSRLRNVAQREPVI